MFFNQIKPGMYLKTLTTDYGRYYPMTMYLGINGPRQLERICKVIETRFYKRHGYVAHRISEHGKGHRVGQRYKLIFAKWSTPLGKCWFKNSYGCPFKKLAKQYGCGHNTNTDYYCDEAPAYAKDVEQANILLALLRLHE